MINKIMLLMLTLVAVGVQGAKPETVVVQGGIVHLRGALVNGTCSVAPESRELYVNMGTYRTNQFGDLGSYVGHIPFSIHLNHCVRSVIDDVKIRFTGVTDGKDPQVLLAGSGELGARGVGIALFDVQDNLLPLNGDYAQIPDLPSAGNMVNEIHFIARYRATSHAITPGKADAMAWFTMVYE